MKGSEYARKGSAVHLAVLDLQGQDEIEKKGGVLEHESLPSLGVLLSHLQGLDRRPARPRFCPGAAPVGTVRSDKVHNPR